MKGENSKMKGDDTVDKIRKRINGNGKFKKMDMTEDKKRKNFKENFKVKNAILFVHDERAEILPLRNGYDIIRQRGMESLKAFELNPDRYKMIIIDQSLSGSNIKLAEKFIQIRSDIPIILLGAETPGEIRMKGRYINPKRFLALTKTVKRILKKNKNNNWLTPSIFLVRE
jgi:hypothetical protein